jgi:hypothetical protein
MERAFMDIISAIDLTPLHCQEAVVAYNPTPFVRSEVVDVELEIPKVWKCKAFEIQDEHGNKCPVQIIETRKNSCIVVQNPNDTANLQMTDKYCIRVKLDNIPGMGYKAFKVLPVDGALKLKNPKKTRFYRL